jgi:hypothetical protein
MKCFSWTGEIASRKFRILHIKDNASFDLQSLSFFKTADETHKVPLEQIKTFDRNYVGIWTLIENFIKPQDGDLAVYCMVSCLRKE